MHETTVERDDKELSRNERLNSDKRGTVGLEKRGGLMTAANKRNRWHENYISLE